MCMSSSLNLSLQKQGAGSGDPDAWIAAKLWIPVQARKTRLLNVRMASCSRIKSGIAWNDMFIQFLICVILINSSHRAGGVPHSDNIRTGDFSMLE